MSLLLVKVPFILLGLCWTLCKLTGFFHGFRPKHTPHICVESLFSVLSGKNPISMFSIRLMYRYSSANVFFLACRVVDWFGFVCFGWTKCVCITFAIVEKNIGFFFSTLCYYSLNGKNTGLVLFIAGVFTIQNIANSSFTVTLHIIGRDLNLMFPLFVPWDTSLVLIMTFLRLCPPFKTYFTEQRNTFVKQIVW